MSEIAELSLSELKKLLDSGELSSLEVVEALREQFNADAKSGEPLNGYIEFFNDAEELAIKADTARKTGTAGLLEGLPIAVKDNILISGRRATCGSAILKGFTAPYSSTVVERLMNEGAIPIGRTNMDEFAMGSTCEYSVYGPTKNPVNRDYVAGGSSGGSAAVVAAKQAPCALGSETGGSVRLPASFCGTYGLKPTYGSLSRYGLVAFGSSLDQIGIVSRNPDDIALVMKVASGFDSNDATSADIDFSGLFPAKKISLKGKKVALPEELSGERIDDQVRNFLNLFKAWLAGEGVEVQSISIPLLKTAVAMYYIIAPAEASSNLARYDGVRYGFRDTGGKTLEDLYIRTRTKGFGEEVKRRIFIGNYVLSSGYYDAYYKKAMKVRYLLKEELNKVLKKYDFILSPTSPVLPFKRGEKIDDPLSMYLIDICTVFANLALLPALSIPVGIADSGLPVGMQLTGRMFKEGELLQAAKNWFIEGERK
ncbi:MAG: Asp-tRNA(Asn)/Glu-tRNA(Gln) amidotransferase subunit GatA [Spirochaetales bacterium]|nr:Asp-tRNA(Asn)/Glu-tRNA(Gln) amidotransferase subunit GatA [Spirochaetales bacterium]